MLDKQMKPEDYGKIISALLRLLKAKNNLLVAYRLSSHQKADSALTAIDRETEILKKLGCEL